MITLDAAARAAIERVIDELTEQLDEMPDDDPGRKRVSEALQRLADELLSLLGL